MGIAGTKKQRKRFRDERSSSYFPRRITLAGVGFLVGMGLAIATHLHVYLGNFPVLAYPPSWIYWAYLFPVIIAAMGYAIGYYAERASAGSREIQKLQEKLRFSDRTEKLLDRRTRELKAAKQELDRFFALSADLLAIADAEGHLQRINPAFTAMLEFPEEKLLGHPLLELVHEGDRPAVQEKIREFKRDTAPIFFECRCLCRSGGYRWLFWAAQPTIDGTVYLIGRDVTEQKRTQIQLQALTAEVEQQAQMLDQILSSFPDRVYLNDRSGRFQYVSKSGASAWGMTKADMIGKTWLEIGLPPEIMKPLEAAREQVFVTGQRHVSEFSFSEASEIRHFEYIMTPIWDDRDNVQAVVTTVRDITERRRSEIALRNSEARLFKFLDNIPLGILVVDGDGNPCYLNRTARETLEIPPGTRLQSNTLAETLQLYVAGTDRVYPNEELPVLRALIRRSTVQATDVELNQANRRIPLEIQASPVFNGDGRVEYAVATFQDISARKQAEALALLRAREEEREKILRTVQEGLFIIDREGKIGSQYSAALESILEETNLAGRNLKHYLESRLPERLLNSALDYLNLMFDPALKEKLIRDVNPLQEVEVFFEDGNGQYRSKFLSFQFRRIMEEGEITGLLVSVTDVTRRVQLARQLEATESRAKQQMELLLGIIHIEPAMMADFLESVEKELTRINRE
ncbi:MAG: PAS domain S-box protein, partial [Calditrichaeota bacterium]